VCESLTRQLEQLSVELIAGLDADGSFVERGYTRPGFAVADLLGCDTGVAVRRVRWPGRWWGGGRWMGRGARRGWRRPRWCSLRVR